VRRRRLLLSVGLLPDLLLPDRVLRSGSELLRSGCLVLRSRGLVLRSGSGLLRSRRLVLRSGPGLLELRNRWRRDSRW
jgi:hypothetical protein